MTRYAGRRAAAILSVVTLAACTSGGSAADGAATTSAQSAASAPSAVWPTYHGNNQRTGVSSAAALKAPLHRAWSKTLDGAVYAQPIVVGQRLIVATENDSVYALRRDNGHIIWRRHLGTAVPQSQLPCGNIDPTGITGTPAYDRATGTIFVVTETTGSHHTLRALNWQSGSVRWTRSLDVLSSRDRTAEQERGALLVAHGRVYVPFGGRYGDCGNYVGYVVGVPTSGRGTSVHYAVPTARAAGMWAAPGPVQDKTGTAIYVSSGNGAATGGQYDGSDSVIQLGAKLDRLAFFAPSTWASDNAQDQDLGSSSPVIDPVTDNVVIAGKRGTVYVLDSLSGVGRSVATTLTGCAAYGGAALTGQAIVLPCSDGIRRLYVADKNSRWSWQISGVAGSPVIASGRVYALDTDSGELVMASLRSGSVLSRVSVGSVTRFATPVPVGNKVYVGTYNGVVAVGGA